MNENASEGKPQNEKISGLKILETAAEWQWKIASELAHPVIPDELQGEERVVRLLGIRRQRERHLKFARVLAKAVLVRNNQRKAATH
jgi:hypothetical protein